MVISVNETWLTTIKICTGAFNRVSLRRARLLGRWRWISSDLSRSHIYYENTISVGCGSDRSKRFCQFPLSRGSFHRESLFAKSTSSHGSNISGTRLIFRQIIFLLINIAPKTSYEQEIHVVSGRFWREIGDEISLRIRLQWRSSTAFAFTASLPNLDKK